VIAVRGASRRPSRRALVTLLVVIAIAGCGQVPSPTPAASAAAVATPATPRPSPGASVERTQPAATAVPPTNGPQRGPIAGVWRVRRVLAQGDRTALLPTTAYGEDTFDIRAGCSAEPCPAVEVRSAPIGQSEPVTTMKLVHDAADETYRSPRTSGSGPCVNADGDRVPGGASVVSTLRLWLTSVRQAGSAVETPALIGRLEIDLAPTPIGTASGCERETASYDLAGRREAVAVLPADPDASATAEPDPSPATDGLVALPTIEVKVPASKIDYFAIRGDSVRELVDAVSRGGVAACGTIDYEWYRGDARPSACTETNFSDLGAAIDPTVDQSSGRCTIASARVGVTFTIHIPRWTAPKRVPGPLLAWWRDIVTFIRDHEAGHVKISRDAVRQLNAKLDGAVCASVNSIVRKWASQLSAAQEAYDRREYRKPWPVPPFGY